MIPRPTTRLLALLELLQARDRVTGTELARRLEVNARSVRRYIAMLQEIGIPVEASRGPDGGYRLRPGFKLPPLMLGDEEAVVMTLALAALPLLGIALEPATVEGARAKLERVLPTTLRQRVQALERGITLAPATPVRPAEGALVALLGQAASQGQRVTLCYRSEHGEVTERLVDPYGVARWSRAWYLAGHCHLRGEPRLFRLDRISAAEPVAETFSPPADFDCHGFILRTMAAFPARWSIEITVGLPLEEAQGRLSPAYGTLEAAGDATLFRGRVEDLDGAARWLVSLGCPFVVRQPPELRAALRRLAQEIAAQAPD